MPPDSALPLTVTNIVLGVLVIGAVLYVVSGPIREMYARVRRRRAYEEELNHDMAEMFPSRHGATVATPAARARTARSGAAAVGRAWRRLTGGR